MTDPVTRLNAALGGCYHVEREIGDDEASRTLPSRDDVEVLDTLLDASADIEAPGGVIADGTLLDNILREGNGQTHLCRIRGRAWTRDDHPYDHRPGAG